MSLKKLNVYALMAIESSMDLIGLLLRSSKDQDLSISSTHAGSYHKTAFCKQKRLLNSFVNLFQTTSTYGECIMISTNTKMHKFDKTLFLKKSSTNASDTKETKQPLNDIPQDTTCMAVVLEAQQATNVECAIPKAVEVVAPEKTYPPIESLDQVDTQILEACPVKTESNSFM